MRARRVLALLVPTALLAGAAGASPGDVARGKVVYDKNCEQCHGAGGDADGAAAPFMLPRPRVFRDNVSYKFRTTPSGELPTDEDLFAIITRGLPGTAMPGFGSLSAQERWDVVAYIKSLAPDFEDPLYVEAAVPMPELANPRPAPATEESLARGQELYDENKCWQCHGEDGRGDGPSWPDLEDEWGDPILPADLTILEHYRGGAEPFDIYRTMSTGLNGTPMPAYADSISPEDRWHLVNYMLSLAADGAERRDVIVAPRLEAVPESAADPAWDEIPATRFETLANIVEAPRLYWPAVTYVRVRAAYDEDEVALLVEWNDRSESRGTNVETAYQDRDGTIYHGTDHPDQLAIQFPSKTDDPRVRPYFLFGDRKRSVNLWWWRADEDELVEMNGKGWGSIEAQGRSSRQVEGSVAWENGRWTMLVRRPLSTQDEGRDVQFASGAFVPIAFSAWDGDRGEVGQRRALTTWYWLYLEAQVPRARHAKRAGLVGLVTFGLLGALVMHTRRRARA